MKKNKIKKIVTILCMLTVLLSGLCGCASEQKAEDTVNKSNANTSVAALDTTDQSIDSSTKSAVNDKQKDKNDKNSVNDDNVDPSTNGSEKTKTNDKSKSTSKNNTKEKKNNKKDSSKKSDESNSNSNVRNTEDNKITCTISIDCKTLLKSKPSIAEKVSNNGVILSTKKLTLKKGSTVYDALKASGISYVGTSYIESISGLSQKDGGSKSGWMFSINGTYIMKSCNKAVIEGGDDIAWRYTCNGGSDL